MPAPISVIIPTLNAAHTIGPTLECLYLGATQSLICEVIFVDGGSNDNMATIADDVGAVFLQSPKGRGSQLHMGARVAKGKWLLFVHADTVLSPDWVAAMGAHVNASQKAAYCKLAFNEKGFAPRWISCMANLRSKLFGLPYGDQTLLISKSLYEISGGYPDIPLMEDVVLIRNLRGKLKMLPITATTSSDRYVKDGWFRRASKNLGTLTLYFCGVSPEKLSQRYRR